MIGYKASKVVEIVARECGASEENARLAGTATATGFTISGADPIGGLGYIAEGQIKESLADRAARKNSQV